MKQLGALKILSLREIWDHEALDGLEAAIACRPAGTTLRPPARQPEVRMSMCPVLGTLVPFGIHRTCRIVADWLRAQRSCLENPNMVTHGLRLARGASWTGAKHSAPSNGVEAAASAEPSPDWVWCGQARGSSRAAASRRPPSPTEAARGRAACATTPIAMGIWKRSA
jgi:hypothetical protein